LGLRWEGIGIRRGWIGGRSRSGVGSRRPGNGIGGSGIGGSSSRIRSRLIHSSCRSVRSSSRIDWRNYGIHGSGVHNRRHIVVVMVAMMVMMVRHEMKRVDQPVTRRNKKDFKKKEEHAKEVSRLCS